MNHFGKILTRKRAKKIIKLKVALNNFVQPFKELPSINDTEKESTDRLCAHDLFSFYTADIIKKDVIFTR